MPPVFCYLMAMTAPPALSVVVPVFNEAENVLPLLEEIHAALAAGPLSFEVVYVDDGSRDETPARLREARVRYLNDKGITCTAVLNELSCTKAQNKQADDCRST